MKRSELQRKTPLQSHSTLKRTSMNRTRRSKTARAREFSPDVKSAVDERSQGICEMCHQQKAVHKHHVVYKSQGGMGDIGNCLNLCYWCHERCHADRETRLLAVKLAAKLAGGEMDGDSSLCSS